MKCPSCHQDNDRVIDSRASHDGFATRRAGSARTAVYATPPTNASKVRPLKSSKKTERDSRSTGRRSKAAAWNWPAGNGRSAMTSLNPS